MPTTRTDQVAVDGGAFDLHVWLPESGTGPGVLLIQEIFGVSAYIRAVGERLAALGYVVGAPDVFWRIQPNWESDHTPEGLEASLGMMPRFDFPQGVADCVGALHALGDLPEVHGGVGVVGFCLGGTMAYLAAARTDADAAVGYYGTRIHWFTDDAKSIDKPLILHFGELDHTTPPELLQGQILPAIKGNPNVQAFVYPGMVHAFANHRRPDTYSEEVTKVADTRTFAHFRQWLAPQPRRAAV